MTDLPGGDVSSDLSIAEHGGHIKGTTVGWVSVGLICGGFVVGGIALIEALPWLFFVGVGAAVIGGILSWSTHAMSNVTARVKPAGVGAATAAVGSAASGPASGGPASGGAEEPAHG